MQVPVLRAHRIYKTNMCYRVSTVNQTYTCDFKNDRMTPVEPVQRICFTSVSWKQVKCKHCEWNANTEICSLRLTLSVFACRLFSSYRFYSNNRQGTTFLSYISIKGGRLAGKMMPAVNNGHLNATRDLSLTDSISRTSWTPQDWRMQPTDIIRISGWRTP